MASPGQRPLRVGLVLPQVEDDLAGHTPRWTDLLAVAQRAEAIGFDSLWLIDHMIYQFPFDDDTQPPHGLWECWSLLAALAATTERVELGTLVACTNFRNPALLAKTADTIDEISGGRLILGLGAGYHAFEFRAFGYPTDHLIGRFEEALAIICPLLREGQVDFAGQYYRAEQCEIRPRGPRPGGPPVLLGGTGKRILGLTARYADSWNIWGRNNLETIRALQGDVDAACAATGRDPATLERTAAIMVDLPGFAGTPVAPWVLNLRSRREPAVTGSTEELAGTLRQLADDGITHVQLWIEPNTVAGVEAFAPVLDLLDNR
jgi:alkanesulfonate monooxygenase SsuD/methylene tetrahydromethanopterin reductase-like flavin-dependent oxidoreductase (luciferase family)